MKTILIILGTLAAVALLIWAVKRNSAKPEDHAVVLELTHGKLPIPINTAVAGRG